MCANKPLKEGCPVEVYPSLHQFVIFSASRSTIVRLRAEENAVLHHSQEILKFLKINFRRVGYIASTLFCKIKAPKKHREKFYSKKE